MQIFPCSAKVWRRVDGRTLSWPKFPETYKPTSRKGHSETAESSHSLTMSFSTPTDEDKDELLLSCRYGDLEDIQQFVEKFGPDSLNDIRDGGGNSVLHMVSANGHTGVPHSGYFSLTPAN